MTRPRGHDDDGAPNLEQPPERVVPADTGGRRFRAGHRGNHDRVAASMRRRAAGAGDEGQQDGNPV